MTRDEEKGPLHGAISIILDRLDLNFPSAHGDEKPTAREGTEEVSRSVDEFSSVAVTTMKGTDVTSPVR
jgi:hypothetical protein